jgi:SecD/SecF fusion protein
MLENVGRYVTLIVVLVGLALGVMLLRDRPFRMGLDLAGGTRMVCTLDFEESMRRGEIGANEDRQQLLIDTIGILRNRVDPTGVREIGMRQEGRNRIVIEVPGAVSLEGGGARGGLAASLDAASRTLTLAGAGAADWAGFPASGGEVAVDGEHLRYVERVGAQLRSLERGYKGTPAAAHAAGAAVELVSDDILRNALANVGDLAFLIVAVEQDLTGSGTTLADEQRKFDTWREAHPGARVADFNELAAADGGPHERLWWFPAVPKDQGGARVEGVEARPKPVLRPASPRDEFTGDSLARVYPTADDLGYPAVGFEFDGARREDFAEFTGRFKDRQMAIVLNDEIETAPNIEDRLPGGGIIQGRYKRAEVDSLVRVLRSGSLKIRPIIEHEERVGPTLGAENVSRNVLAGILAFLVTTGFMLWYYRLLGVFASISLVVNIVLLLGGMSFIDATLTLPGLGGIILTIGMALDANVLIFERIREESEKGANAKQAGKTGFEKAMSAIVDSNITTLLSALILYNVGTGPVRGFAVTLAVGILSTMFAQLVVCRVLVHYALARGVKQFKMSRWLGDANYRFLAKARACIAASIVVVLAGTALFVGLPDQKKLGIEFLGGATARIETEEPLEIETVRQAVRALPGVVGETAEVKQILESGDGQGRYTSFRITYKQADADENLIAGFERDIRVGLESILQRGPVSLEVDPGPVDSAAGGGRSALAARGRVYLADDFLAPDLAAALGAAGLDAVQVSAAPDRPQTFELAARFPGAADAGAAEARVLEILGRPTVLDSQGRRFALALPISESATVGKQVVGELRDKAIVAVVLSLLVIVLYIRVRFAEYSWGFGAVTALTHDVLVTLGAIAVAVWLGFIACEMNMTMIAVLLTIIGYSINDTIVIFDRVRENREPLKKPLREVIEISINQTLARTIITSLTVFLALVVMLGFNLGTGNALEGFCYAMLCGMISGVYSTVYIASPVLLWFEERAVRKRGTMPPARPVAAGAAG